jgi:NADPH:quinone reductase-like Zn-dependent oxidoreductase
MKAAVRDEYGGPDRVRVRDVAMPNLTPAGALVRVRAASLNRIDWYELTGSILISRKQMGMRRPTLRRLGFDFAGVVEAVGVDVSGIAVGDEVYGVARGSLAEYVVAEKAVIKPAGLSFEEAATAPLAGVTALQAVRDKAGVAPGHRVLVNGASGGVGAFTVQIAKALGADHVIAVCSSRHHDAITGLGADEAIDYAGFEFAALPQHSSQVAIQVNGSRSWSSYRRVLQPGGTLVIVGGPAKNRLVGPLGNVARMLLSSRIGSRRAVFFISTTTRDDLDALRPMLEQRQVVPVIDRVYDLDDAAAAFEHFGGRHLTGKVVVAI